MKSLALLVVGLFLSLRTHAEEIRRSEVIYGRKFGTALTLDVLQPPKTNGLAVVWVDRKSVV